MMPRSEWTPRRRWWVAFGSGALAALAIEAVLRFTPLADRIAVPILRPDTEGPAEVAVVLGAGVDATCAPNLFAIRRTHLAARWYRQGRVPMLLFTGGPSSGSGNCTVARAMADLAEELGVPSSAVLLEESASSTWENARNSSRLLRARGVRRVLLVTDCLHMRRAEIFFRAFGFETERSSVPALQLYSDNLGLLRAALHEWLGLLYHRLGGYAQGGRS